MHTAMLCLHIQLWCISLLVELSFQGPGWWPSSLASPVPGMTPFLDWELSNRQRQTVQPTVWDFGPAYVALHPSSTTDRSLFWPNTNLKRAAAYIWFLFPLPQLPPWPSRGHPTSKLGFLSDLQNSPLTSTPMQILLLLSFQSVKC